ncbi:HypC/HybG/HupF family hydrogenase formation chaperone [Rhodobacter maris]|uniref:Hydrogenase maturation protein HypC n=1 Tax=Rhodobacter maris TaxID=446682 RepID=A0A285SRD7_9RHOB|nr:HypC/HybG/HupF family hydrogenase formation chaperone [Rhodobacter maris]SOC10783.1 Hydrogenase maturation protein HypC [Rhodobacter maris]
MCLGVPVQIEEMLENGCALVTLEGVTRPVSLAMIEAARPGDWVIVHAGIAWERVPPEEAAEIRAALALACAAEPPLA